MYKCMVGVCAALALAVAGVLSGCGRHAAPETGAKQAAKQYLEAFCGQDWPKAYAALDAESRAHESAEQYIQWVTDYRRRLGFDVEASVIASCQETGDKAVAEVSLSGREGNRKRKKDIALALHRNGGQWCVVLPAAAAR